MTFEKIAKLLFAIDFEPKNMDLSLVPNELLTPLVTLKVLVFPLPQNKYSLMVIHLLIILDNQKICIGNSKITNKIGWQLFRYLFTTKLWW